MIIAAFIIILIFMIVETVYWCVRAKILSNQEKSSIRSLVKYAEYNVLKTTLINPVSTAQATQMEKSKVFVRVEFLNAKPWMAYLFDLSECVTIGRSVENKISIRDEMLSRFHCKIFFYNGGVYVQDLGSANGTIVKGSWFKKRRITSQEVAALEDGDVIDIGNYKLRVKNYYGWQAVE